MEISIRISTLKHALFIILSIFVILLAIILIMNNNPKKDKPTLSMGAVELNVKDLQSMKYFYSDLVGLEILNEEGNLVELGDQGKAVIKLYQFDDYEQPSVREAGLYHSAMVFSERSRLVDSIRTILTKRQDLYQGSADHIATEAFYFSDPEGNGVELYFDKPKSDWQYGDDGKPLMGSTYIDEAAYIQQYGSVTYEPNETRMGHVHLKVGNIPDAKKFYSEILDFDLINEMPNALFVSKDNYHHHLGMNTWESAGSTERIGNKYGLRGFTINIYDELLFSKIQTNLDNNKVEFEKIDDTTIKTQDSWNNVIYLKKIQI